MSLRHPLLFVFFAGFFVFLTPCFRYAKGQEMPSRSDLLMDEWEADQSNLRVAMLLGNRLRDAGQKVEAIAVVEKSLYLVKEQIKKEGDSSELEYLAGMGALFLDQNYSARNRFQRALSLDPEREEIHLGLVRALLRLGKEEEAMQSLELAKVLFPESDSIKAQLAEIYVQSGRDEIAIPYLEELRVLYPENPSFTNSLLRSYERTGQMDKAKSVLDQLVGQGSIEPLQASLEEFRMQLGQGDFRGARVALQNASEIDENDTEVAIAFRDYYAVQADEAESLGNHRRALIFWERALERMPNDMPTQYRLALAHAAVDDHEKALEFFLPLMKKQPTDPRFYADLSLTLIATDQLEAAARTIQLGYDLVSKTPDTDAEKGLEEAQTQLEEVARTQNQPSTESE